MALSRQFATLSVYQIYDVFSGIFRVIAKDPFFNNYFLPSSSYSTKKKKESHVLEYVARRYPHINHLISRLKNVGRYSFLPVLSPHEAIYLGSREAHVLSINNEYDRILTYFRLPIHLLLVKWLYRHACISKTTHLLMDQVIREACIHGNLDTAQFFLRKWTRDGYNHGIINNILFVRVCGYGQLRAAQWLMEQTPQLDPHSHNNNAFFNACMNNHLHVAQWLFKEYGASIHIGSRFHHLIYRLCRQGYLHMIQWLLSTSLSEHYTYLKVELAFENACESGHLQVARWIMENFSFDPWTHEYRTFKLACYHGYLHVVQWLLFMMPPRQIRRIVLLEKTPSPIIQWWETLEKSI